MGIEVRCINKYVDPSYHFWNVFRIETVFATIRYFKSNIENKKYEDACEQEWLNKLRESLVYNNIQVFISGSKQRKSMVLDSFLTKGDANLVAYTPITVLYYGTKTNVANQIPYDTIGCNITYSEKLHDWNYYKKLINLAL